ncbi:MAG: pitrilysin family protein [Candidatus Paceibacterota bacterium]|jgi:predicted Zn-dependent peptidase
MKYIKKTLENGLRIVLVPLKDTETVTVMVLAETGSEYEEKSVNGISHFLEHMCFKGTTKRPSSRVINHELDSLGSQSNAFTNTEYTGFYAKAHAKHTSQIIDIVSDIYLHSVFPEEEMQKEKGVVIEEINMYEDRPDHKVWEVLGELMYDNQSAGRSILGTKETVGNFTRDNLIEYHKKHYVASGTLVVIAGKIEEEKVIQEVEKAFAEISAEEKWKKEKVIETQIKPESAVHFKDADQTHLVLAFRSFDTYDKRNFAASVLSTILGGGMSSRLFSKMREDLGICYYIRSSHSAFIDHGSFVVSAGVSNTRVEEAIKGILEEVKKITSELVSPEELRKAKDFKIGNLFLNLETSDSFADFYGYQEIYREEVLSPEEVVRRIEAVTVEEVQSVARDIFQSLTMNLAIVGPHKDTEKFRNLLEL